jgi:CPA1 family monovalent cation:H+ antiporter
MRIAEWAHVSPVFAVLLAGPLMGNHQRSKDVPQATQIAVDSFWEYAAFVVNSLVFLLIGLETHVPSLLTQWVALAWGILAMLVSRIVVVYGLMPARGNLGLRVEMRWRHVLFWGGLPGALSIALVLSLPDEIPDRSRLVLMVLGAVTLQPFRTGAERRPTPQAS